MKNLKVLAMALVLATGTTFATSNPLKIKKPTTITQEVGELLKNPAFKVTSDIAAKVTLIINDEKELVVVDVDTKDPQVESYIKSRLNYQKIASAVSGSQIVVPVRVMPGV